MSNLKSLSKNKPKDWFPWPSTDVKLTNRKAKDPSKVKYIITIDYGKGEHVERDCLSKRGIYSQVKLGLDDPLTLGVYIVKQVRKENQ